MCIIVSKEKGIELPSMKILETCFNHNHDGAGLMYCYDNRVKIVKGLMTFKQFKRALRRVEREVEDIKDINLVMHFRIGTKGKNDGATTHPFPVSNSVDKLTKLQLSTDMAMVHNGIIHEYSRDTDLLSDTQHFVKEFVYGLKVLNQNFLKYQQIKDMVSRESENTKLVFLNDKDEIFYIGNFVEDNGVKYSNTSYKNYETQLKNYTYNNYFYNNYAYLYKDWYDEDDYDEDYKIPTSKSKRLILLEDLFKIDETKYMVYANEYTEQYEEEDLIIDKHWDLYKVRTKYKYSYECELLATDVEIYDKETWEQLTLKDIKWGNVK